MIRYVASMLYAELICPPLDHEMNQPAGDRPTSTANNLDAICLETSIVPLPNNIFSCNPFVSSYFGLGVPLTCGASSSIESSTAASGCVRTGFADNGVVSSEGGGRRDGGAHAALGSSGPC